MTVANHYRKKEEKTHFLDTPSSEVHYYPDSDLGIRTVTPSD